MAKKPKYPFNDWSKPLGEELFKFIDEVHEMACRRFGVDADGDKPVQLHFIDRTIYEPLHYEPVPYDHQAKTQEDLDEIERVLLNNLDFAMQAVQTFNKLRSYNKKRVNKKT